MANPKDVPAIIDLIKLIQMLILFFHAPLFSGSLSFATGSANGSAICTTWAPDGTKLGLRTTCKIIARHCKSECACRPVAGGSNEDNRFAVLHWRGQYVDVAKRQSRFHMYIMSKRVNIYKERVSRQHYQSIDCQ